MHIAIINLTSGKLSGGYKKYLNRIIPLFQNDIRVEHLYVFTPSDIGLSSSGKISVHIIPLNSTFKAISWIKTVVTKLNADVVFIPTGIWFNINNLPTTVMIHNMEPLRVPFKGNSISDRFKNIIRYISALRASRKAHKIIAVSEHVSTYLKKKWRIDPNRIAKIYHGVDIYGSAAPSVCPESFKDFPFSKFIFMAGSIRPARGLEDAIDALKFLKETDPDLALVIAGQADPGSKSYLKRLKTLARKIEVENRILWAGQLSEEKMTWCYKNCLVFVMTSRAEACPNIALEAMSHSCTIVSTTELPMPEIFGSAAIYYELEDSINLAQQLSVALGLSEEERNEKRLLALDRAKKFSWEQTARLTIDQLQLSILKK